MSESQESSLTAALRHFETAEANLIKLERLWEEIKKAIPSEISFGSDPAYEDNCRAYVNVLAHLPTVDGWKPTSIPMGLNEIGQMRFDAAEVGELSVTVSVDELIFAAGTELRDYRFRLNQKRRQLIRDSLLSLIDAIDADIRQIYRSPFENSEDPWGPLRSHVGQIDALLGSAKRPDRWSDLRRHMSFAEEHDLDDIQTLDWPVIKKELMQDMYGENEPIPSEIGDLSDLVKNKPAGPVTSKLNWEKLSPEGFERLVFSIISATDGYENPQWLMNTNAPDRGRDLSVERVIRDPLGGVSRLRVIIQCKHWLSRSVNVDDVSSLQQQMKLWEPPRVDVHVITTSGRFTSDAVALIEKDNQSDRALKVEMWPESHLETLLASRPHLIAQFSLR